MKLIDPENPFFQPAWRRWVLALVPFAWAIFEASSGNDAWAYLSAAIGGILVYNLVLTWPKPEE
jgi:hypothetical protein